MTLIMMLSSCVFVPHEAGRAPAQDPTSSSKNACHHRCQAQLRTCVRLCHLNRRDCSIDADKQAARRYQHYIHEQNVQGKPIILELKSFRDPLQCQKTSCECLPQARVCRQFCEGTIRKRLRVVPPPC